MGTITNHRRKTTQKLPRLWIHACTNEIGRHILHVFEHYFWSRECWNLQFIKAGYKYTKSLGCGFQCLACASQANFVTRLPSYYETQTSNISSVHIESFCQELWPWRWNKFREKVTYADDVYWRVNTKSLSVNKTKNSSQILASASQSLNNVLKFRQMLFQRVRPNEKKNSKGIIHIAEFVTQ